MSVHRKVVCDVCGKEINERIFAPSTQITMNVGDALTADGKKKRVDFCDLPCFAQALNGRIETYINPEKLKKLPRVGGS